MDTDAGGTSIQDQYLGKARKDRSWLTVVLNSGKKIGGRIVSFDRYTVILEDRGSEQMVFKHAIATISSARSFSNTIALDKAVAERRPGVSEAPPPTVGRGGDAPEAAPRAGDAPAGSDRPRTGPPTDR